MTILVDDSGWGSPLGGVLIAAYRPETAEMEIREVPVSYFQGNLFRGHAYLGASAIAAESAVTALRKDGEPVHICSGYIHAGTHRQHPDWKIVKIAGPFQAAIEQALLDYLHKLGFPYQGSTEAYGKLFYEAIRWLKGGKPDRWGMDPERVKLGKTGWATWPIYQKHPYKEATHLAKEFKRRLARERRGRGSSSWNGDD